MKIVSKGDALQFFDNVDNVDLLRREDKKDRITFYDEDDNTIGKLIVGDEGHAWLEVRNDDMASYAQVRSAEPSLYLKRLAPHTDNLGFMTLSIGYFSGQVTGSGNWLLNFSSIPSTKTAGWLFLRVPTAMDPDTGAPTTYADYWVFGWQN